MLALLISDHKIVEQADLPIATQDRNDPTLVTVPRIVEVPEDVTEVRLGRMFGMVLAFEGVLVCHIPDKTVSRLHLRLLVSGGDWQMVDPGSTNGTYVDGVRLAYNVPVPVRDGSHIRMGRTEILVNRSVV